MTRRKGDDANRDLWLMSVHRWAANDDWLIICNGSYHLRQLGKYPHILSHSTWDIGSHVTGRYIRASSPPRRGTLSCGLCGHYTSLLDHGKIETLNRWMTSRINPSTNIAWTSGILTHWSNDLGFSICGTRHERCQGFHCEGIFLKQVWKFKAMGTYVLWHE